MRCGRAGGARDEGAVRAPPAPVAALRGAHQGDAGRPAPGGGAAALAGSLAGQGGGTGSRETLSTVIYRAPCRARRPWWGRERGREGGQGVGEPCPLSCAEHLVVRLSCPHFELCPGWLKSLPTLRLEDCDCICMLHLRVCHIQETQAGSRPSKPSGIAAPEC